MRLARSHSTEDSTDRLVGVVPPPTLPTLPAETDREQLFEQIYRRLHARLLVFAERLVDIHDAEDAVHDAMLKLWSYWGRLLPEQRTDPYIFAAVHNSVLDTLQSAAPHLSFEDAEAELAQHAIRLTDDAARGSDAYEVLNRAVAAMPLRRREAFLLHHEQGFTYKEVAATMRVSEGTVNNQMYKAIAQARATFVREGHRIKGTDVPRLPRETGDPTHE
jgi:RNA polymerase sigma factor (sigma-70 family)